MEELRPRYEAYREESTRAAYRVHSGQSDAEELLELDDAYGDLTSGDPLDRLRTGMDEERLAGARDAYTRLIHGIEEAVLVARARVLQTDLFRPGLRLEERVEIREEAFARLGELRQKLGYATGVARVEACFPEIDLDLWLRGADRLLEISEPVYRDALTRVLAARGVDLAEAREEDLWSLAASSVFDSHFPAEQLVAFVAYTCDGLGVRPSERAAIAFDAELRSDRAHETRAFPVRVPGEISISAGVCVGARGYQAMLAALGPALAAAFTSAELPVERRRDPDPGLQRGWALLFADLFALPAWIDRSPAEQRGLEFAEEARLARLLRVRSAAALFRTELELARVPAGQDPHPYAEIYTEEQERALCVPVDPRLYLENAHAELRALHELRAACFAVQAEEFLRQEFGTAFFAEPRCGGLLKELWNTGTSYDADALALELGFGPLDLDHVADTMGR